MNTLPSRRSFIKTAAIAGSGMLAFPNYLSGEIMHQPIIAELYTLSNHLIDVWGNALLHLQVADKSKADYGGILSPDNNLVPGRSGDAVYPFFYLANKTKDHTYLDAGILLYNWMEKTVSQPDGSWLNEPVKGSWKGITVFTATALVETLKLYGDMMDKNFKSSIEQRLKKAGEYIADNFSIDYGNINYPIAATYCLSLLNELLGVPSFKEKGKSLAEQAMKFITAKDGFIYGEGTPYYTASPKGCFSVDLGYNVEESLPALVLYAKMNNNAEILSAVTRSLHTHLEFMLPDGGWDNSWGTRNFKWTYWGSRTSDGCQPAYALMGDHDPVFYTAALANTKLLQACTKDGLLHGGLHCASHGIVPGVHHTFCHIKALVTTLTHGSTIRKIKYPGTLLPREQEYGVRFFSDIQTWLIAKGKYRATVTGYDREYKETKNGHPTGGALSLLWHKNTGPLLAASMNEYQLFEAVNMRVDEDPLSMPLTARIEMKTETGVYMNISDLAATIEDEHNKEQLIIKTRSKLVDKDQKSPAPGQVQCQADYIFSAQKTILKFSYDKGSNKEQIRIIIPVISKSGEIIKIVSSSVIEIKKENATVRISANQELVQLPTTNGRVFNFVPGLEAIPLAIYQNNAVVEIDVID
ncbi:MAG: twin-arginine translocation signal domain-containing protein [Bacteroidota bacterium]